MQCVIKSFLKDKELANKKMNTVNKSIEDIMSRSMNFGIATPEYIITQSIVYGLINAEINNLCELYEEYMLEGDINGTRILDKNSYIEEYISNINDRITEIIHMIPELASDYMCRNSIKQI
ncbi:TPA: hypothetical protein ACMVTQ_001495 [Clostridioides difficile]|uniref:hypothetical protein n=1 Tax=Clostridioides difficile TaxID=1496 RepID=UPI00038DBE59|nr:hypothetical protein [Clostridioides difficile]EQG74192.1 hypothetical protein QKA_3982 [Clostridioides difficile DA00165]EAA0009770.1 hypothetical protein [Clostridioides difficile]EGT3778052.1 hypothetical protein [Clostridioides difficile]EGT3819986.1 hypothetical protein [Clostridioides difficile]EGT3857908.1 hypothetical protein [Clostridioides difficile]